MPRIERTAEVVWTGNLARGEGRISAGTGAFTELPFSLASRIGSPEGKTSPEELLAAAHAGCFGTSLAGELTRDGSPPDRLHITCHIAMDEVEGAGHQIVASRLVVVAGAAGTSDEQFTAAVARADDGCPFSGLLKRAGADVTIDAALRPG